MLTDYGFADMVYGDHPDYRLIEGKSVVETTRWSNLMEAVVQEKESGTFYRLWWQEPATECQECEPDFQMTQVYPKKVTKTIYVTEKEKEQYDE